MNAPASRDARSGPGVLRRAGAGARGLLRWFDAIVGGQDYQRYVAHLRRTHPDRPIPTEREYWRERHDAADRNPSNRCC